MKKNTSGGFMNHLKRICFLIFIMGFAFQVFGGGQNRAGTSSAPALMIPVGSQYIAMGGANVSSVQGLESIFWNPAGVALSNNDAEALFSYRHYIADMNMNFVAASGNLGFGVVGITFRNLNVGDINVTTMDQPDGTGEILSPTYFVLGLTYANALTDRISIGASVNLINESWGKVTASGLSFDFGVQYKNIFTVPNLSVGIAVKNLGGAIQYEGSGLFVSAADPNSARGLTYYQVQAAEFELPSTIALGVSYSRQINEENSISIAGAFNNNNFSYDNYRIGAEYSFNNTLFVRGGYLFSPDEADNAPNIYQDFSAGIGINFGSISSVNICLDYAYIPVEFFDANHSFTIKMGF
jgi:hypothetical protein